MKDGLSRKRFHTTRIRNNRKRYHVVVGQRHRFIDTPKPCSCFMCGNPRKWDKADTLQERRYSLKFELKSGVE